MAQFGWAVPPSGLHYVISKCLLKFLWAASMVAVKSQRSEQFGSDNKVYLFNMNAVFIFKNKSLLCKKLKVI
jgi:hypothetical protein